MTQADAVRLHFKVYFLQAREPSCRFRQPDSEEHVVCEHNPLESRMSTAGGNQPLRDRCSPSFQYLDEITEHLYAVLTCCIGQRHVLSRPLRASLSPRFCHAEQLLQLFSMALSTCVPPALRSYVLPRRSIRRPIFALCWSVASGPHCETVYIAARVHLYVFFVDDGSL